MWQEADKKSAGSSSQISKRFSLKRFSLNLRPSKNSASKYLVSTKFSLRKVSLRSHDRRRLNSADSCWNPNHPSHHGIYSVLMVVCSCTSSVTHCTWVYCHVFIVHCWLFFEALIIKYILAVSGRVFMHIFGDRLHWGKVSIHSSCSRFHYSTDTGQVGHYHHCNNCNHYHDHCKHHFKHPH